MQLKTISKLNPNITIEATFDAKDLQEAIRQACPLLELDSQCPDCASKDLTLRTRKVKDGSGNDVLYTELFCKSCGSHRTFGVNRDKSGYFLKPWEKKFTGNKAE